MKKVYKYLAVAASALALAACSDKPEFVGGFTYVTFDGESSYSVSEEAPAFQIPVSVQNAGGKAFRVTVAAEDGTAVGGTNYKVTSPESGVLDFKGDKDEVQYITVAPVKVEGYVAPGKVSFAVALKSATEGVEIGAFNTVDITINDADHPLNDIIGTYTVHCTNLESSSGEMKAYTYTMHLTAYDGDVTKILCDGICPMAANPPLKGNWSVYGEVSEDHKTIVFPNGQASADLGSSNGGVLKLVYTIFHGSDGTGYYVSDEDVVFTATPTGFESKCGIGFLNDYVWPSYGAFVLGERDGFKTTWTRVN